MITDYDTETTVRIKSKGGEIVDARQTVQHFVPFDDLPEAERDRMVNERMEYLYWGEWSYDHWTNEADFVWWSTIGDDRADQLGGLGWSDYRHRAVGPFKSGAVTLPDASDYWSESQREAVATLDALIGRDAWSLYWSGQMGMRELNGNEHFRVLVEMDAIDGVMVKRELAERIAAPHADGADETECETCGPWPDIDGPCYPPDVFEAVFDVPPAHWSNDAGRFGDDAGDVYEAYIVDDFHAIIAAAEAVASVFTDELRAAWASVCDWPGSDDCRTQTADELRDEGPYLVKGDDAR